MYGYWPLEDDHPFTGSFQLKYESRYWKYRYQKRWRYRAKITD